MNKFRIYSVISVLFLTCAVIAPVELRAETAMTSATKTALLSPPGGSEAQEEAKTQEAFGPAIAAHPQDGRAARLDGSRGAERGVRSLRHTNPRAAWRLFKLTLYATQYGAIMAAAGGMLLLLLVGVPAAARRPTLTYVRTSAGVGLVSSLLLFGAAGVEAGGLPLLSLLTPEPWILAVKASNAFSVLFAVEGLAALLAASMQPLSPRERGPWWMFGVAGALVATMALATGGQVSTAEPRWFIGLTGVVHGVCAAFWVGSLYPLMLSVRHGFRGEYAVTLSGFSRIAAGGIGALLAAGVIMSEVQLQDWRGFGSAYGCCLVVKLSFVAGLLAVAGLNSVKLQALVERGSERGARLFTAAVNAHLLLALGTIIATAALSLNPAPRAQDADSGSVGRAYAVGEQPLLKTAGQ